MSGEPTHKQADRPGVVVGRGLAWTMPDDNKTDMKQAVPRTCDLDFSGTL